MNPPIVFISYSHDSPEHKAWVLKFATDLRSNGVDAILDQWDLSPGQDIVAYMNSGIINSNRVLVICTEEYLRKAEAGLGGVGYERLILTAELVQNIDTRKFIPIVRNVSRPNKVPIFLGPRAYVDFSREQTYQEKLTELLAEILGSRSTAKPPIGPNPFSGSAPTSPTPTRLVGATGATTNGKSLLDDQWFNEQRKIATKGLAKLQLTGSMELRFALHEGINKSQIELLNAMRSSEIRTFGWPIGIVLNRDEYRPRPFADGVRAELSITEKSFSSRSSYDYWALRSNGDFYLLQDLFEDQRGKNKLFFNTRIVRVTEALLFSRNLYKNLGVSTQAQLTFRILHEGLKGRELSSSNPSRFVFSSSALENESIAEITLNLVEIDERLPEHVRLLTAPMFMLFDFKEFSDGIYVDIIQRFNKGEVS